MKFRELLNETEEVVDIKPLVPVRQKFREDVLGEKPKEEVDESSLPPGFSKGDIESVDAFAKEELKEETEEVDEDFELDEEEDLDEAEPAAKDADVSDIDIGAIKKLQIGKRHGEKDIEKGKEVATKQSKLLHASNILIVTDDGKEREVTDEELIAKMSNRPEKLIGQNTKIAKSGSDKIFYDLTLPSYQGLFVDEKAGQIKVVRTCPMAGECKKWCYASKGGYIQYPASSLNASRLVTYFMNDWEGFKAQLLSELKSTSDKAKKHGKTVVLRWHDSGDFISPNYLMMAMEVANESKDFNVRHYAYTKMIPLVKSMQDKKPDNFLFRFSFGGEKDELIDTKKDYHAKVVPLPVFKNIPHTIETDEDDNKKMVFKSEDIPKLKEAVAKHFDIDPATIKTYQEIIKMPEGKEAKWNVLIWKGDGDEEAQRDDVLGVYLFIH